MGWKLLLFFGPFLFVRKIVLIVLLLLITLGLILYFVVNSPRVIQELAEEYASDYNISYDSISGSAFTGLEIQNPRYKQKSLAKSLSLKWNPNTLVSKRISINKLHLVEGDVDVIKGLVASFSSSGEDEKKSESQSSPFDFTVDARDIDIDVKPFKESGFAIDKLSLQTDALTYSSNGIVVENIDFVLESNVSNIMLTGDLKDQVLDLEKLSLLEVDVDALMKRFGGDSKETSKKPKSANVGEEEENLLIPRQLKLKSLEANILPITFDPIKIKSLALKAEAIDFDINALVLTKAQKLSLEGKSNLTDLSYKGWAKENHLLGKLNLAPKNALYTRYKIPVRDNAIKNIAIDFDASQTKLVADLKTKAKAVLKAEKDGFNLDVEDLVSHVEYRYKGTKITAKSNAVVTTAYARNIAISNDFAMDKKITYQGDIKAKQVKGFEKKFAKPLSNLLINYQGTTKGVKTVFSTDAIKGTFDSVDFKGALVHVETQKPLLLKELLSLPKELEKTTVTSLVVDAPLDFNDFTKIPAKILLRSNVINLDTDVVYAKAITLKGKIVIPPQSLLKAYEPKLKWRAISRIDTTAVLGNEKLDVTIKSKALNTKLKYNLKNGNINGKINLSGLVTTVKGNTKKKFKIETQVKSMKALRKSLSGLYPIEALPPITGAIKSTITVDALKRADLTLRAAKIVYTAGRKTKHTIKDIKLVLSMDASKILLKSYNIVFNKQKYFSNKTATVTLGDTIKVSSLWLNEELEITGDYTAKNQKGRFEAHAKSFNIKDKLADIKSKIDIKGTLEKDALSVKGTIVLLEGRVKPNLDAGQSFASDSDIIIVQEMQKSKKSPFMNNLVVDIKIKSKKGLRIKQGPMNIRLKPNLNVTKHKGSDFIYLGSVNLLKGGTYIFEDKRFVLAKSAVYFTGDVKKPSLDIKARYKTINYLITIAVTGSPASPNIKFLSNPHLSREEILSVILFGTEAAGSKNSGVSLMKMMGGAMAKAALSEVGVEVDHLVFGEDNSVEVGKKITNKATVIYINAEVPRIKFKYQHGRSTESVIGVSQESRSYDIIFKKDF